MTTEPTTTTATTATTTSTTTTTKKAKTKKKKKPPVEEEYDPLLLENTLTVVNNKLVPVDLVGEESALSQRYLPPGRSIGVSGRRLAPPERGGMQRRYPHNGGGGRVRGRPPPPPNRNYNNRDSNRNYNSNNRRYDTEDDDGGPYKRLNMPNFFSQGGFDDFDEEKPKISRPPPQHPGVNIPGIRVPANAGNIQDIIDHRPHRAISQEKRYTSPDGKYTIVNDYRPPIWAKPSGSQVCGTCVSDHFDACGLYLWLRGIS
jgi:hypothetical protein